ncbi:hypothetical protein PUN28_014480 [Cardiocondyla obscurior]|uniref:Uncharacterized protein n=1 Tax=Cardiocondyla obscurior TaxID=286306 RepID=A0AAW2F2T0_9HYME
MANVNYISLFRSLVLSVIYIFHLIMACLLIFEHSHAASIQLRKFNNRYAISLLFLPYAIFITLAVSITRVSNIATVTSLASNSSTLSLRFRLQRITMFSRCNFVLKPNSVATSLLTYSISSSTFFGIFTVGFIFTFGLVQLGPGFSYSDR